MIVGFNRKWISCAALLLILLICCIYGIYSFLTQDILVEGGKMSDSEKNLLLAAFTVIGIVSATSLTKLLICVFGKKVCFKIDENGISDTVVLFGIFTLYFVFTVKSIPWKAIKSTEKDPFGNSVNAKINKEYINDIAASPIAKIVLKYFGYSFGHGLADANADEIVEICNKYKC